MAVCEKRCCLVHCFIAVFLLHSQAQSRKVDLTKEFKLKGGHIRFDSLFQTITRKSGVTFSFNPQKINSAQLIKTGQTVTLLQVLNILNQKEWSTKIIEDQIIITSGAVQKKGAKGKIEIQSSSSRKIEHSNDENKYFIEKPGLTRQRRDTSGSSKTKVDL